MDKHRPMNTFPIRFFQLLTSTRKRETTAFQLDIYHRKWSSGSRWKKITIDNLLVKIPPKHTNKTVCGVWPCVTITTGRYQGRQITSAKPTRSFRQRRDKDFNILTLKWGWLLIELWVKRLNSCSCCCYHNTFLLRKWVDDWMQL